MAEVKFWVGTEKVDLIELTDKLLIGIEKNGKLGHADVTTLMKMLAAASASGIEPTVEPLTTLPAPAQAGKIMIMKGGDYLQPDGVTPLEAPANSFNVAYWDGTVWSVDISIETEADLSGYTQTGGSGKTAKQIDDGVTDVGQKVSQVTIESKQLSNNVFEAGYYNYAANGNPAVSVNWLRLPMMTVDPAWIGQEATIYGFGNVPASGSRVVIRDASNNTLLNIAGAVADLTPVTFTVPSGAATIGFTIVNEVGAGDDPENSPFKGAFMFNLGAVAQPYEPKGTYLNSSKLIGNWDLNEIIITKNSPNWLYVYYHSGGDRDVWIRQTFARTIDAVKFIDTWRLDMTWLVSRTGDIAFTEVQQIVRSGAWENAINSGYADFLGSVHGWEQLYSYKLMIDEVEINTAGSETLWRGSAFSVIQASHFKTQDGSGNVGRSLKSWDLRLGKLVIRNDITWLASITIQWDSYLSMCPVLRKSLDNLTQITHSAIPNDDMLLYDVSEEGFMSDIFSIKQSPIRNRIVLWGDRAKVDVAIAAREVTKGGTFLPKGLPDAGMYIQNTSLYNKIYGGFGSDTVSNGDRWRVVTEYLITAK